VPKSEDKEFKSAKTVIIGHIHPSVTLSSGARNERYKAFVVADWKEKKLIIMPSFSTIRYGFDLINEEERWAFLNDAKNEMVYIAADQIYDFGMLEDLKKKHAI
jgi:metallophosphoesterase superfamily enzyme